MKKARDDSSLAVGESEEQKGGILEAQRDKKKVHFATLMDMCHVKKMRSWKQQNQKYIGRVVF